ncbi:MAG: hypothetical protein F4Z33_00870 [Gemmatimonadales bacterium]|nr:hypothetical protein [Gemmatimonadales bacterium]MYC89406.1 hypothetical protein [Candidatus Palauibacter denitrificans]
MSGPKDVADALRAYVAGRDRVWEHGRKLGRSPTASVDASREAPLEIAFGELPARPKFGVSVAGELDFRRGPAAWRDRPRTESPDAPR